MADVHLDDELRVDQTTPQGSQENAVETGHEVRDTNVGGIMKWLIGTGVLMVVSLVLVVGIFRSLEHFVAVPTRTSPLYQENKPPVAPYIEGLIVKNRKTGEDERAGMTEHMNRLRQRENETLEGKWKMGKSDPDTYLVEISPEQVKEIPGRVEGDEKATDAMFTQGQLSDANGGLRPIGQR